LLLPLLLLFPAHVNVTHVDCEAPSHTRALGALQQPLASACYNLLESCGISGTTISATLNDDFDFLLVLWYKKLDQSLFREAGLSISSALGRIDHDLRDDMTLFHFDIAPRAALAAPTEPYIIQIQSAVIVAASVLSVFGAGWIIASFFVRAILRHTVTHWTTADISILTRTRSSPTFGASATTSSSA
jgi:hypothetical protein